jgi:hypothetical protein
MNTSQTSGGIIDESDYLVARDVFPGPGIDGALRPVRESMRQNMKAEVH